MEELRSFIAIELTEEMKASLRLLQACLKKDNQTYVKWVDPEGVHLTLKFLGNIAANRVSSITNALVKATSGVTPFQMALTQTGVFPNLKRVQVAWVGLGGDIDRLKLLQQRIESCVAPLGFPTESRAFTPHLTVARLRESALPVEREKFGQLIAGTKLESTCSVTVDSVSLMRSQLTREGAIYSKIGSAVLKSAGG